MRAGLGALVMLPQVAVAGPWVRDPGHFYAKGSFQRYYSEQFVDENNQVQELDGVRFESDMYAFFGEVGTPLKGLQVIAMVPFVESRNLVEDPELTYAFRNVGDVELALEYGRNLGNIPVSLNLTAKIPFYDNHLSVERFGSLSSNFPILGDGQLDLTAWLAVGGGWSLGPQGFWAFAEVGYRHRTEFFPLFTGVVDRAFGDGLTYHGQLGWMPNYNGRSLGWWFLDINGLQNFEQDAVTKQFLQFSTGLAGRVWERPGDQGVEALNLEAGIAWIPLARNAGTGWSFNAGLSLLY